VDLDLAPVADVVVSPNPIVGVRSFGSDPALVARHVAAFVEGLQGVGVAACAKHFPGHGETEADSHLGLPVASVDGGTLYERALPPFRAAIAAGVRAVMTAHVRFPALGEAPATLSPEAIRLLRAELGFHGLVITDALEMPAISGTVGLEQGAVRALAAGADALCLGAERTPEEVERVRHAITDAVAAGSLPKPRLQEAGGRVTETAAWTSPRPHSDREAGAEAARRALEVVGDASHTGEPLVVELRPEPSIAAGKAEHGLGELLGAETLHLREGDALPPLEAGRQLILVLRDAHRHAWQRALVRRGAIVVETGYPAWRPEGMKAYVVTYGAGRANLAAAAARLRGAAAAVAS
jgi:beta-N-acetylhexosaminidase